jgi:hypothetical protein
VPLSGFKTRWTCERLDAKAVIVLESVGFGRNPLQYSL